jgi:hypothetical protein
MHLPNFLRGRPGRQGRGFAPPQSFDLAQRKCEQAQPTAHASSLAQAHAPSNGGDSIMRCRF